MEKVVLIVDDSRFARMTMRSIVTEHFPRWFIAEAADGVQALARLEEIRADFVLLDYNMPGEDGITVAGRVLDRQPQAAIALVTANVQDALAERARTMGLSFIKKPVARDIVLDFLKKD